MPEGEMSPFEERLPPADVLSTSRRRTASVEEPRLPLIPGHQIVGTVEEAGDGAGRFSPGERVGVPWLGWTCDECRYCASHRENLCERAGVKMA